MLNMRHCPVCRSRDFSEMRSSIRKYDPLFSSAESTRENWILEHVVRKTELELRLLMCKKCTHIFTNPTFSGDEISRMYNYTGYHETIARARQITARTYPSATYDDYRDHPLNRESLRYRPVFIHSQVKAHVPESLKKIADIGGGEGINLGKFQEDKTTCYVLDVADGPQKIAGVIKTKNYDELKRHAPFDLLISTHTLEHIVDVGDFMDQHIPLSDYFYCEVPSQYAIRYLKLRQPFLNEHVNYFSMPSLRVLFESRGFQTLHIRVTYLPYQIFRMPVIVGIFKKTDGAVKIRKSRRLPFLVRELGILSYIQIYRRLTGRYPPFPD